MVHSSAICTRLVALISLFITAAAALDVRVYPERGCGGVALACTNIPLNVCCNTDQYRFKAVKTSGPGGGPEVKVNVCNRRQCDTGFCITGFGGNCITLGLGRNVLSIAVRKAYNLRRIEEDRPKHVGSECKTPDSIVYIDDNGKEVMAKIPQGKFEIYANAVLGNDLGKLKKLLRRNHGQIVGQDWDQTDSEVIVADRV